MEPIEVIKKNKGRRLELVSQIIMADGKEICAHYDSDKQIFAFTERLNGRTTVCEADMGDLTNIKELSNIKVFRLALLPMPQEFIALLFATKMVLDDTLLCMRIDKEFIRAAQLYSPKSTFFGCKLRLDQTNTNLTVSALASTTENNNICEKHTMPVYLGAGKDFIRVSGSTKKQFLIKKR